MKTVALRELLRQPLKIKRWTRAGQTIQVNDNGKPLWVIKSVQDNNEDEQARRQAIEEMFQKLDREPVSRISLSGIVKESRR